MANVVPPPGAAPVEVNGRVIDPQEHYAKHARETNHIIVGLKDNLTPVQAGHLEDMKVHIQEDLGNCNYLCRYEPADLERLRALDFVSQADVYRNKLKVPQELVKLVKESEDQKNSVTINVMPHHEFTGVSALNDLADHVAKATGLDRDNVEVLTGKVQACVRIEQIQSIAEDDFVRIIEQVLVPDLTDKKANHVVYAPLQVSELREFHGDKQVIAVIDTGFDLGATEDCHPAFEGRIEKLISLGRASHSLPNESLRYDDPDGHGTHVCGTIVGRHIITPQGPVGGVAPQAKLVLSSTSVDAKSRVPVKDIPSAFGIPYRQYGARIFSNSWGDNLSGTQPRQYGTDAELIDAFVREQPDALVIFSAGNNNEVANPPNYKGPPRPAIGSQAAAKNCVTVGASGSTREVRDQRTGLNLLDPDRMYPESSRGRIKGTRVKPDVVAPGFSIFSARSRHSAVKYTGFRTASDQYSDDVTWQTRSGTSHATPLVAGCAAVLRELAQERGCEAPPAALLKAILINGADKLPDVPTEAQGFGRVNLLASGGMLRQRPYVADTIGTGFQAPMMGGTLIGNGLSHGDTYEMAFAQDEDAQAKGLSFKATMVYNDKPGGQVQNNLNLAVIDTVTGDIKHAGESETDIEKQDNVEQVVLSSLPSNPFKIRITAQKITPPTPGESQDWVLAWTLFLPYTGARQGSAILDEAKA
ncbi:MAG: hypothetical protein M1828_004651 [Chrysothrix sp. TS-e1954]|nr:MAG: hypothetical protein M1828_004651 [Chrysothrix sp. TS-e1954]